MAVIELVIFDIEISVKDMGISMIILQILKIIGLVLLYILLALIGLILLVFLWPYFYLVKTDNKEDINFKANVSWFFHIVSVWITYTKDDGLNYYAKLFGIKVYDKKKKDEKAAESDDFDEADEDISDINFSDKELLEENNEDKQPLEIKTSDVTENSVESQTASGPQEINENKSADKTDKITEKTTEKTTDKKKRKVPDIPGIIQDMFEKFLDYVLNLPEKLEEITRNPRKKVEEWADTIIYYKKLFSSKGTEYVLNFLKKYLGMLIKELRPYRSDIKVDFANTDPSTVATVMELYGMLLPYLPKHTVVNPDFDRDEVKFDVRIKGEFSLLVVTYILLRIILNKKVIRFYKLVKREK